MPRICARTSNGPNSEDVIVVCDMDTGEFVQIEIPMDENGVDEVIATRDT